MFNLKKLFSGKKEENEGKLPSLQENLLFVCNDKSCRDYLRKWIEHAEWEMSDFDYIWKKVGVKLPIKIEQDKNKVQKFYITELCSDNGKERRKLSAEVYFGDRMETFDEILIFDDEEKTMFDYELWPKSTVISNQYFDENGNVKPLLVPECKKYSKEDRDIQINYYTFFITAEIIFKNGKKYSLKFSDERSIAGDYTKEDSALLTCFLCITQYSDAYNVWKEVSNIIQKGKKNEVDFKMTKDFLKKNEKVVLSAFVKKGDKILEYATNPENEAFYLMKDGNWQYYNEDEELMLRKYDDSVECYCKVNPENKKHKILDKEVLMGRALEMKKDLEEKMKLL